MSMLKQQRLYYYGTCVTGSACPLCFCVHGLLVVRLVLTLSVHTRSWCDRVMSALRVVHLYGELCMIAWDVDKRTNYP